MVASPVRALVSEQEFLALPETNSFVELLDGEVIVSPSSSYRHQLLVKRIGRALDDWNDAQGARVVIGTGPQDIRFAAGRILQPDVYVLQTAPSDPSQAVLSEIPLLCVEIVSTNRTMDRVTKRYVYGESGVREYWVVEQYGPVERYCGQDLSLREELTSELTSALLPSFSLDLTKLFAE